MTKEEYTNRLEGLRKEYADAIRAGANGLIRSDIELIEFAESESAAYRTNVQALISEYHDN